MKNVEQMTMFEQTKWSNVPLAERMRPDTLDKFVGQGHIVDANSLLRRAIRADRVGSCIFWGPPGSGKTTLSHIIANSTGSAFVKLNAVSSGVADAKKIIEQATERFNRFGQKTYLLLDECHRWNKAQSDCVLPAIEKGIITFIGSTTENPYVAMTRAIVSRCRVFEFKYLTSNDVKVALKRAVKEDKVLSQMKIQLTDEALEFFAETSVGDLRSAYNGLELAALTTNPNEQGVVVIDQLVACQSMQKKALSVDTQSYYDMISAFIKSMRGSDADAALFWFARLIQAGCDPMLLARRIVIQSAEDVGLAEPSALSVAVAAMTALQNIGLPEARIPLAQAILYVCNAPKSNSVEEAIDKAMSSARQNPDAMVPPHLMDTNYPRETQQKHAQYKYPHAYGGWVEQQYLPDKLVGEKFYIPSGHGKDTGCKLKK